MGYKRDGKTYEAKWTKWRQENEHLILASGVPDLVVSTADYWHDFLAHGCLDHHEDPSRFAVENLTIRQKAFLLQLIGTEEDGFRSVTGQTLIVDLISAVKDRYRE